MDRRDRPVDNPHATTAEEGNRNQLAKYYDN